MRVTLQTGKSFGLKAMLHEKPRQEGVLKKKLRQRVACTSQCESIDCLHLARFCTRPPTQEISVGWPCAFSRVRSKKGSTLHQALIRCSLNFDVAQHQHTHLRKTWDHSEISFFSLSWSTCQ